MANGNLEFRLAALGDAAHLQQMVESAFRAEDSRPEWTADMALGERFRLDVGEMVEQISKPDGTILIATDEDNAFVASVNVTKRSADLARISMLAVVPHHQRGGIGRQVLDHAENYCQQTWGVKKIGLNALSTRQQLIAWYTRRGYKKTGELTLFPYDRIEGLSLPDDLCFVELKKDLS